MVFPTDNNKMKLTLPPVYRYLCIVPKHTDNIGQLRDLPMGQSKKRPEILRFQVFFGGDKRDRTADLLNAIQALSQLSYTPVFNLPEQ